MGCYSIAVCVFVLLSCSSVRAVIRRYYIAAEEVEWDYAPSGRDLVFNHQSEASQRITASEERIGSKYTKAVYKEYTDASFRHEIYKPDWHGYQGPIIRGELDDVIVVHFKNALSINKVCSIHPHGLFYKKNHEGAFYLDGESGAMKMDDGIQPGSTYTYIWNITKNFAPTDDDDNCIPWAYHSHVASMNEIESGLVGVILACKKGALGRDGKRRDVTRELVLHADVTDETDSFYMDHNMRRCLNPSKCQQLKESNDKDFRMTNKMYHFNGYVYGNLPRLDVCEGETVAIYMYGLTNGFHSLQIYGQTMVLKGHRMDTVTILPATFIGVTMVPHNVGSWLLICRNTDHFHDGMTAFFNVKTCAGPPMADTPPGKHKRYYIAAEEVKWNYMPSETDQFSVGKITIDHGFSSNAMHHNHQNHNHDELSNVYKKAVFVEYEDAAFSMMKPRPPEEEHLHVLGPPIKVEVGDILEIVFFNKASRPYSIFPHGVGIDKSMEGSVYYTRENLEVPYGAITSPNTTRTYRFTVPWTAAPTFDDPNCITYTYHSAVDVRKDTNTGLVGPLLVCKPGSLDDDGKQVHVNREFFVLFNVIDENLSWYIDESVREFAPEKVGLDKNDEAYKHGNLVHAMNGRIYGTLNGLDMCLGDRVAWHFFGLGSNHDLHTVSMNGNAMSVYGRTLDTRMVLPGIGFTGYMHPDDPGKWALFCHTHHHLMAGMSTTYNVNVCPGPQSLPVIPMKPSGAVRRYYIAAVDVNWDYAPSGVDKIIGERFGNSKLPSHLYTRRDSGFLGTTYKKAVYREFTDDTFQYEKKRGYREIHLGVLGPFIRAEVGDVIEVIFMNKASRPFSIQPHGVFYDKGNEGMNYNDKSDQIQDNEVQPTDTFTYRWKVPLRAGPGPNEPNCIGWMYHSGTNMIRDTPTGLMGPLITCRRGVLDPRNNRLDQHDREFAILFYIMNENRSWYIGDNIKVGRQGTNQQAPHAEFEQSNMMNSINGYVYGNTPGMVMEKDEHVTWYAMGLGSEDDFHTIHFHGQTYVHRTAKSHRADVIEVYPGTYETVDMHTDNTGTWLMHCHVMDHLVRGMEAKYAIVEKGALRLLDEAEADRKSPIILHKLPVIASNGPLSTASRRTADSRPPTQRTVFLMPPQRRAVVNSPISRTRQEQAVNGDSGTSGFGAAQHNLPADRQLRELYRSGVLPDHWQINTRSAP